MVWSIDPLMVQSIEPLIGWSIGALIGLIASEDSRMALAGLMLDEGEDENNSWIKGLTCGGQMLWWQCE